MHIDEVVTGHPAQHRLVEYAESLLGDGPPISVEIAAHVSGCGSCAAEVDRVRASLRITHLAASPEPSDALTQRILLQARGECRRRREDAATHSLWRVALYTAQVCLCIVGAALLAMATFGYALRSSVAPPLERQASLYSPLRPHVEEVPEAATSNETLQALSTAISLRPDALTTPQKWGYRRVLDALDRDFNAAASALERNPGSLRAGQVMRGSIERQLEGLRNMYLDRVL